MLILKIIKLINSVNSSYKLLNYILRNNSQNF